ncbi:FAD:protein FMN transferase [Curtobacterium oceanosedimentum]|uniref:FAD:protein FMN transferase n=1 Tax=Curtobacterium oceanosedimentum TaxID=465820 RepID=UPI000ACC50ED|nr:FAD:protein FMN transferase [Curtobacterium oceanosedimentum]
MSVPTFETMGTVVSLRGASPAAASAVRAVFAGYDHRYSLWDPASVLSRIAAGSLRLPDAPEEVRDVYALALSWRDRTGGAFTPHRPDGIVDLSGVVKALAIQDAGEVLDAESDDWMLSAGGDVLVRGTHRADEPWSVGVVDPARRDIVVGVVRLAGRRRAVATSGTAERGEHIWRRSASVFVQATVVADDIVTADVLATAIVAGDEDDLRRLTADGNVDVLAFGANGTVWATPGAAPWVGPATSAVPAEGSLAEPATRRAQAGVDPSSRASSAS